MKISHAAGGTENGGYTAGDDPFGEQEPAGGDQAEHRPRGSVPRPGHHPRQPPRPPVGAVAAKQRHGPAGRNLGHASQSPEGPFGHRQFPEEHLLHGGAYQAPAGEQQPLHQGN